MSKSLLIVLSVIGFGIGWQLQSSAHIIPVSPPVTLNLVYTVCFKGQCHEYIAETYTNPLEIALEQCKLDGSTLDNENGNSLAWNCSNPRDYTFKYTPKQIKE